MVTAWHPFSAFFKTVKFLPFSFSRQNFVSMISATSRSISLLFKCRATSAECLQCTKGLLDFSVPELNPSTLSPISPRKHWTQLSTEAKGRDSDLDYFVLLQLLNSRNAPRAIDDDIFSWPWVTRWRIFSPVTFDRGLRLSPASSSAANHPKSLLKRGEFFWHLLWASK